MHYYQFNIGDYASHTQHLDPIEDIAYRRMLDYLYLNESILPKNIEEIARLIRMRTHCDSIAVVLQEFFVEHSDGYSSKRVDEEIAKFHDKSDKAKLAAESRWGKQPSKSATNAYADALQTQCEGNANHKPLTNNHKPVTNKDQKTMSGNPDDMAFLIDYLNRVTGKNFRAVESNLKLLRARIEEGHSKEDIIAVIDRQNLCWPQGDKMRQYMRPETLFNATKFNQYAGELGQPIEGKSNGKGGKLSHADNLRQQARRFFEENHGGDSRAGGGAIRSDGDVVSEQSKRLPDL